MKEYTGDKIRNVAIVGHGGAGTTSVTEALLYRSGAISRMCKVEDGATTPDYEPEEIKRRSPLTPLWHLLNGVIPRLTSSTLPALLTSLPKLKELLEQ